MMTETALPRAEDPSLLTILDFLKRAIKLPINESAKRILEFLFSFPKNIFLIPFLSRRAKNVGKSLKFVFLTGRMGDLIAAEPAVRHAKQTGDYIIWLCRPRYRDVLMYNPSVDKIMNVSSDTEAMLLNCLYPRKNWLNLNIDGRLCNVFGVQIANKNILNIDAVSHFSFGANTDVFSLLGVGQKLHERPRLYPDPEFDASLYLKEVFSSSSAVLLFHPLSDEFARSWSIEKAQAFGDWVLGNTQFNIIELGLAPVLKACCRVIHLGNTLAIPQQMAIFGCADLFVGVDSGFSHMANAVEVPSIFLVGEYHGFRDHVPWRLNERDIVLRGPGQTHEIGLREVCEAVEMITLDLSALQKNLRE